jgi:hypothetical protein
MLLLLLMMMIRHDYNRGSAWCWEPVGNVRGERKGKEVGGKYDQSTLNMCMKIA